VGCILKERKKEKRRAEVCHKHQRDSNRRNRDLLRLRSRRKLEQGARY
jgi:hypothetical protein